MPAQLLEPPCHDQPLLLLQLLQPPELSLLEPDCQDRTEAESSCSISFLSDHRTADVNCGVFVRDGLSSALKVGLARLETGHSPYQHPRGNANL